jgi:putative holliday junction resolvase
MRRHETRSADFKELQALVDREQVKGVLVGLPLQERGNEVGQARWVLRYAGRLAGALSVPLAFWDESLSSHDAAILVSPHSRESLDAIAAALILQDFLEARRLQLRAEDP